MSLILHIIARAEWERALLVDGYYRAPSLETEGFIHCSTPAQVANVANAFYKDAIDLVLLCIDPNRVESEVRFEPPAPVDGAPADMEIEDGALFPHIYGPLNGDAVLLVVPFEPDSDGTFSLPPEIAVLID
jgi:uncharacterized protein (DUF952 family)